MASKSGEGAPVPTAPKSAPLVDGGQKPGTKYGQSAGKKG